MRTVDYIKLDLEVYKERIKKKNKEKKIIEKIIKKWKQKVIDLKKEVKKYE